ncbi:MAG: hypothetical protein PVG66_09440 [Chromatiales bacterium]|jgi:NADH:ubiquinone oxidoreductase subunit 4 (subunit M)
MEYLLAAVFLPIFPFSIVFNALFARIENYALRMLLLVTWPAAGIYLVSQLGGKPPQWIIYWAAFTALLYAFRSLVMRELNRWTAYIATSIWALLWLDFLPQSESSSPWVIALALAVPLVLMPWISGQIKKRFGGAYAGTVNSLAITVPRLSILLVFIILAAIATPVFPGFFALLGMVNNLLPVNPLVAVGILLVWLLWTWSGIRVIQGLIVGPGNDSYSETGTDDINPALLVVVTLPLIAYVIVGLSLSGELL